MYFAFGWPKILNVGTLALPADVTDTSPSSTIIVDIQYNADYSLIATVTEAAIFVWSGDQVIYISL
jgi:hypothetical protein